MHCMRPPIAIQVRLPLPLPFIHRISRQYVAPDVVPGGRQAKPSFNALYRHIKPTMIDDDGLSRSVFTTASARGTCCAWRWEWSACSVDIIVPSHERFIADVRH